MNDIILISQRYLERLQEEKGENLMLYIDHLSKTFGEKKAVDDLTLHIAPGEIYGFIGHNGAGKTTTLKSVVGIQQFEPGRSPSVGIPFRQIPSPARKCWPTSRITLTFTSL